MFCKISSLAFIAAIFSAHAFAQATPDAQQLLAASDSIRTPSKSYVLTTALTEYRAGKQVDSNTLSVFSKPNGDGTYRTLVRFDAPVRDAGKLMLKSGDDLWFYDPASQASVRISPEQRLLGQESNGDVMTTNFSHDYTATFKGAEDVMDGDRQTRHCNKLELTKTVPDAQYQRIEMWLDAKDNRPVKGKFYAQSDRLLKTAFYRNYMPQLGVDRPGEAVIIDGLDPGWVTVMRFSNYTWKDIPDAWMQRDYLPRIKAQ
ncbi:outer membrane lipoprotein-sorting protein [Caballeronia sp. BR00000012568055]|uniref:outer membrane lipoprotein-sorting protein n=1 Tax=Caballeronia sp. BR00000012568055 TaxID=2918761 RepID=UPI0023F93918|nr:outer membrane lipoprotein-sorting protein [Caballeronia sp. BR00000012568055]